MKIVKSALFLAAIALLVSPISAQDPGREFRAQLTGPTENISILSGATGGLSLSVDEDEDSVHFVLQYRGLQTHVTQSHIHIGKPNDNGGVTVFFCDNTNDPPKAQPCPEGEGTVEGDFTAADVIGLPLQDLANNDLTAVLRAIRAGDAYANLHTMAHGAGEIRGQILPAN